MFNSKTVSGIAAVAIYFLLIYSILLFYNVHKQKAKNYVEKNSDRVTVTLVNSDRTILNRSSKVSTPNRPVPKIESMPIPSIVPPPPKRVIPKKPVPKKETPKKEVPKKELPKKEVPKKRVVEVKEPIKDTKAEERVARIKKIREDNERAKQAQLRKDRVAKERAKEVRIKKDREAKESARVARIKKDKEAKERSKNLFSSVDTQTPSRTAPKESSVRHTSSATDRIRNTHQSGAVSNRNRERGVENAYIAKVQRRLNNWHAQSNYKGQSAKIKLVIKSSGHFRFTILNSSSGSLSSGLKDFLNQLNSMGLGRHDKSTPYNINVTFRAK
ncbi:hypothetical protein GSY74_08385 [Sulfurovum sp. bin170]|uniref:TonB C-terminal domain-containing protein n=1 Tax=Sulfurovum sp. bin170 TaxID=2695268 RepID=UPI0013DF880C|nr:TonB C-terminal domain-containing protein [Sulfurovum sp. bin170]NEW61299.1 hypothetical protein [Sulfurovum sp. bin170]